MAAERVAFGTSGHRGSSLQRAFNEQHTLVISQAICRHRKGQGIDGPLPYERALHVPTTHRHDYLSAYVDDLGNVVGMEAIRGSKITLGVASLGGAGVHHWRRIAERYGVNLRRPTSASHHRGSTDDRE